MIDSCLPPTSEGSAVRDVPTRRLRHGSFLLVEHLLRWVPNPRIRARLLGLFGATVGRNVRVYEVRLINLQDGFANLRLGDDVHVGADCLLDLRDVVAIEAGAVLGPRVTVLTHQDAGRHHGAVLAELLGTFRRPTTVGRGAFVGAGSLLLCGADIGHHSVVAAGSVVTASVGAGLLVAGRPAEVVRSLRAELLERGVECEDRRHDGGGGTS